MLFSAHKNQHFEASYGTPKMIIPLLPLVVLFAQLVSATISLSHPTVAHQRRISIPVPDDDPFFTPPRGWENASNGDVLRTRQVDLAILEIDKMNIKEAHQILYRTTGVNESVPSTTVTTVVVPFNAKPNKLVNYLTFVDADGSQCSPSYTMRKGGHLANDLGMTFQQLVMTTFLNDGYTMTLPDHQGPNRAFAAGRLEGRMSIDGTRATLNFKHLGLDQKSKVAYYGYSGGAIACGWVAALHQNYAPELNVVGYALGGTPSNVSSTITNINGGPFSAFGIAGVTGLLYTYPSLYNWAQGKITDEGYAAIEYARKSCLLQTLVRYPFQPLLSDKFVKGGARLLYEPVVKKITDALVMGVKSDETPNAPVYMYHANHDEIIPFDSALKSAKSWANHGADIVFEEYTSLLLGHVGGAVVGIPDSLLFVRERMEGKSFPKGFTHKKVIDPVLNPRAALKGLDSLIKTIQDIFGKKIGPKDSYITASL